MAIWFSLQLVRYAGDGVDESVGAAESFEVGLPHSVLAPVGCVPLLHHELGRGGGSGVRQLLREGEAVHDRVGTVGGGEAAVAHLVLRLDPDLPSVGVPVGE